MKDYEMKNAKRSYWFVQVTLIIVVFAFNILFFNIASAKEDLCYFDSKDIKGGLDGCAKDMDAEIKEVKREPQISIVHVKVKKRGTYAGSIMYQVCCFCRIAKNRGYRYFVILGERDIKGIKECEWYDEYIIGFLDSKTASISQKFKEHYTINKEYKIEDINDAYRICGFSPVPNSVFHQAVYYGDLNKIKELVGKNKELLNAKDDQGFRPLHIAVIEGYSEIVRYLVSSGADINGKGMYGFAAIHLSIKYNKADIIKLLLNLKADPGIKTDRGNTPLHNAAYRGCVEIADLFVNSGVSVNETDNKGNTPLHGAAYRGHLEMVKYLIANGADPKKKNKDEQTPLFFAEAQKHTEVINFLKSFE